MVFVYLGDIWLVFVCYLGGICLWVVWFRSVWRQRSASIPLYIYFFLQIINIFLNISYILYGEVHIKKYTIQCLA